MRIFLIRHGRQSDERCNVDVGLSEEGRRQAVLVGARMATWGVEALYASDMVRARETGAIVGRRLGLPVGIVPELRELDFGHMTGLTDEEISRRFADFRRRQEAMDADLRYPGGETVGEVVARALPALRSLAGRGHATVAVIAHGVLIRGLVADVIGAPLARCRLVSATLENGGITELSVDSRAAALTVHRVNDFAHLEPHPELLRSAWRVSEN